MGKRIIWCDRTRFLAIVLVVLVHCVESVYTPYLSFNLHSVQDVAEMILRVTLFTAGRVGVPLFLMLTGYLLLPRAYETAEAAGRFYRKNFLPLLAVTEIWIVLYIVYMRLAWGAFSLADSVRYMLFLQAIPLSHMWYMPLILSLYISLPLVSIVVNRAAPKILWPVILFALGIGFILPTLRNASQYFGNTFGYDFQGVTDLSGGAYGLYMVAGFYLGHKQILRKISGRALFWIGLVCVVLADLSQGASYVWGISPYRIYYTNPLILVLSLAVFEGLSRWRRQPQPRGEKSLEMLSRLSFGVFFLHNLVLMEVFGFIAVDGIPRSVQLLLLMAVVLLISYGLSLLIYQSRFLRKWLIRA